MPPPVTRPSSRVFKITRGDGCRFVIYNAAEIGNPFDHAPDKWYVRPYPGPLGLRVGPAFESADEAEAAARTFRSDD